MDFEIVATSGPTATPVPEEVAKDLAEVYETLKTLPSTRVVTTTFETAEAARLFVRQGKSWAHGEGLAFARRGPVKDDECTVKFRIYVPRDTDDADG